MADDYPIYWESTAADRAQRLVDQIDTFTLNSRTLDQGGIVTPQLQRLLGQCREFATGFTKPIIRRVQD